MLQTETKVALVKEHLDEVQGKARPRLRIRGQAVLVLIRKQYKHVTENYGSAGKIQHRVREESEKGGGRSPLLRDTLVPASFSSRAEEDREISSNRKPTEL